MPERLDQRAEALLHRARAGLQLLLQQQLLCRRRQVLDAADAFMAALMQHQAQAAAATERGDEDQQALTAAAAPAARGVGRLDGGKVLLYFAAGVLPAVVASEFKLDFEEDLRNIYTHTGFEYPGAAAAYRFSPDKLKLTCSSSTRLSEEFGKSITAEEEVSSAEGTSNWSSDLAMNSLYSIKWSTRTVRQPGSLKKGSYMDVEVTVPCDGGSNKQQLRAKDVSSMVLLVANAAGVAAVCHGKLGDSMWGRWSALFTPPPAAVRDGRIVGAFTGITKAVAQGVDMLVPDTTAGC